MSDIKPKLSWIEPKRGALRHRNERIENLSVFIWLAVNFFLGLLLAIGWALSSLEDWWVPYLPINYPARDNVWIYIVEFLVLFNVCIFLVPKKLGFLFNSYIDIYPDQIRWTHCFSKHSWFISHIKEFRIENMRFGKVDYPVLVIISNWGNRTHIAIDQKTSVQELSEVLSQLMRVSSDKERL